jgi:hypothetical protein
MRAIVATSAFDVLAVDRAPGPTCSDSFSISSSMRASRADALEQQLDAAGRPRGRARARASRPSGAIARGSRPREGDPRHPPSPTRRAAPR